ncbi:prepilin-type N-terminal cleavage/methylation domain-containing protein [Lysinibacillus sp. NPDC097287]|uniref:prepilin-type N-terminal cleavage/methylation domain-containing protein n=1 Tax=Lysinibacillus sp. NPDC097287 TaxID=3364144 RepID=UPI003813C86D
MFKKLLNKKVLKNEKGLTLIELLAVIVILAIIAAIAVPAIGNIIENSRYNAAKADAINVINAANLYFTDEGSVDGDDVTVAELKRDGYLDNAGLFEVTAGGGANPGALVIKAEGGNALTGEVIYSGEKKATFTGATIVGINADKQKGSGTPEAIAK